jgi:hypothetical protein
MTPAPAPGEAAPDPVTIREWRPGDDEAVLQCHNAVFADPHRGVPERSLAHWRWKFAANPTGRILQMLAVHATEGIVGVYGAIPVRVTCAGRRWLAAQSVDLCVRPEWLAHGGGSGLFPRLGRAFADRWLGTRDDQVLFTYGLPVPAWRSGALHLGWQNVRDWDVTFRELPPDAPPRPAPGGLAVGAVERFDAATDELFARIEPELGLATVRDHRYLNWRYADHPDRSYALFECRERATGRLRGAFVYAVGDLVQRQTSLLVDWLQAADDGEAMTAMLAAAEERSRRDGTGLVCSTWNHADPRFVALQEHGYRVRGTPWFLGVAAAAYDVFFFRERWYFTLGDCDLV